MKLNPKVTVGLSLVGIGIVGGGLVAMKGIESITRANGLTCEANNLRTSRLGISCYDASNQYVSGMAIDWSVPGRLSFGLRWAPGAGAKETAGVSFFWEKGFDIEAHAGGNSWELVDENK